MRVYGSRNCWYLKEAMKYALTIDAMGLYFIRGVAHVLSNVFTCANGGADNCLSRGESMSITQEMIAERVGLDRSTVSKILNGRASDFVSRRTIDRVIDAARELGYDFARLRHTHSRQFERTDLNLQSEFDIILMSGEVFDTGTALVRNISEGSALLTDLKSGKNALPIEPFTISLIITEGRLRKVSVLGKATRFEMKGGVALALEFTEVSPVSARKLRNFMDKAGNDSSNTDD